MARARPFRTALFWCHLVVGVTVGVVVFIMSLTGVLLAYERQITLWADDAHVSPPTAGVTRQATARSAWVAAASVASMSLFVWADDRNHASNGDGGR